MSFDSYLKNNLWPLDSCRFSGYQYSISNSQGLIESGFGGHLDSAKGSGLVTPETLFDLASLTKLFTATLAAVLFAEHEIDLDSPIGDWSDIPESLSSLSARQLLTHTGGLPPEWEEKHSKEQTVHQLLSLTPEASSLGSIVYSCTGYSLFAYALESHFEMGLDELMASKVLIPLGLERTSFNPAPENVAMTEKGTPAGKVHDPRARALEGVSGNAGLFSNSSDVLRFLDAIGHGHAHLDKDARLTLLTPTEKGEWQQAIGFRFADIQRVGKADRFFSHTGLTGTIALLNPETGVSGVLLTNRLSCGTTKQQMATIYKEFSEHLLDLG